MNLVVFSLPKIPLWSKVLFKIVLKIVWRNKFRNKSKSEWVFV